MRYDFLWFDLGYTLLYKKREEAYKKILESFGIEKSLEEISLAFHLSDKRFMRDYPGIISTDMKLYSPWYLGTTNYFLSLQIDLCALSAAWVEDRSKANPLWYPYPFVSQVLEELKKHSYKIGVISNWDCSARSILRQYDLLKYFDHCIISSEVGVEKPKEGIFKIAFSKSGASPERSLYIGDNYYDDALGAAKVGMKAVIINRYERQGIEELPADLPVVSTVQDIFSYIS